MFRDAISRSIKGAALVGFTLMLFINMAAAARIDELRSELRDVSGCKDVR